MLKLFSKVILDSYPMPEDIKNFELGLSLAWLFFCLDLRLMTIRNSHCAYKIISPLFNAWAEELWVLSLSNNLTVLRIELVFRGSANACTACPREIIKSLCINHATQFIIAHNHPSGDPQPSSQDKKFTQKLNKLSRLVEIPLLDHIIVGSNSYFSFSSNKVHPGY